jgi:hypothetical protein
MTEPFDAATAPAVHGAAADAVLPAAADPEALAAARTPRHADSAGRRIALEPPAWDLLPLGELISRPRP